MQRFENRWDEVDRVLPADGAAAIRRYYAVCGDTMQDTLATLWDPSVGGFYYAPSARDTLGFLPDAESVKDALNILSMTDLGGRTVAEALPGSVKEKVVSFLRSLQDADGYFYHPQWGKNINSSRRGRDLSWCVQTLAAFGSSPLYPTPLETEDPSSGALPDYLSGREKFSAYFEQLDIPHNSHSGGHTLSSQRSQIAAAGLSDYVCDLLAALQRPDNGLWEETVDYKSISGMYKIAGIFAASHRRLAYVEQIVESCMKCILSPKTPSVIIYVMNPWGSLSRLFDILKNANAERPGAYDLEALYRIVRQRSAELISVTADKVALFRQEGGLFSYCRDCSSPITQGVPVSTGRREGDLNASSKPICGIPSYLFNCLGIDTVPFYSEADFASFVDRIVHAEPRKKVDPADGGEIPLIPGKLPERIAVLLSETASELSFAGVVDDGEGAALKLVTEPGSITRAIVHNPPRAGAVFTVTEWEMKVVSADGGKFLQILLGACDSLVWQLAVSVKGNTCTLSDFAGADGKQSNPLGLSFPLGEWVALRVVYRPQDAVVEVSLNGGAVVRTANIALLPPHGKPSRNLPQNVNFFTLRQRSAEIRLRRLRAYHEGRPLSLPLRGQK